MDDERAIRDLIENWVLWRDGGVWDRLATLWHADGRMEATWFGASGSEFVERSRKAWEAGLRVVHMLGGTSIDLNGTRAVAQTRMQLVQRGMLEGALVDVQCFGRFWDALEKRDGKWGIVLRQPIYDLDRLSPVDPAVVPTLDHVRLASFPDGYRHLALLQSGMGFDVRKDAPVSRGAAIDDLLARGRAWLSGECDKV